MEGEGSGFYYTRYPQGHERPPTDANFYQQVYFHQLGTESREDRYVIGKDFPRIAEIHLETTDDGRRCWPKWPTVMAASSPTT